MRADCYPHPAAATRASTAVSGAGAIDINPVVDITTGESHAHERAALLAVLREPKVAVARHVQVFAKHGKFRRRVSVFSVSVFSSVRPGGCYAGQAFWLFLRGAAFRLPRPIGCCPRSTAFKLLKTPGWKKERSCGSFSAVRPRAGGDIAAVASFAGISILATAGDRVGTCWAHVLPRACEVPVVLSPQPASSRND